MTEPVEPRRSGFVPAALLGACLLSIAAAGAALPAGLRLFSLTAGSIVLSSTAASVALALGAALGTIRGGAGPRLDLLSPALALSLSLSPALFLGTRFAYRALWPLLGGQAAGVWTLRLALAAALFAPPAFLLARLVGAVGRLIDQGSEGGRVGSGFSFGLGAGGLALGILMGGGVLLPILGMKGSFFVALALAGVGASAAAILGRPGMMWREPSGAGESARTEASPGAIGRRLAGLAAPLFGFALWSAFLCWSRTLQVILGPTDQTLWIAAAVFLLGAALGAFLASGTASLTRPAAVVPLLAAASLLAYGSMFLVPWLATFFLRLAPAYMEGGLAAVLSAMVGGILMLPSTLASGASLAGLLAPGPAGESEAVVVPGRRRIPAQSFVLGGAALAAIATPLLLVPALGIRRAHSLAAAAILLAALLVLAGAPIGRPGLRPRLMAALLGVMVILVAFPAAWDPRVVGAGLYRYAAGAPERFGSSERYLEGRQRGGAPLFYREGPEACVVVEPTTQGVPGEQEIETYVLSIDGRLAANDGADLRTQILAGEIPVLLHGPTDSVLLVDFLTGVTAGSILRHPVRSLTVIEREPAVLKAGAWFQEAAGNPLGDDRLETIIDSPRARLLADPARYDVIVLSATDPWLPHNAALITREGYALLRQRLQPHGLVALRLSLAVAREGVLKTLLRTFAHAFDAVTVFQLSPDDLLLVGSPEPLHVNAGWLSNVASSNAAVAADLRRATVVGPDEIVMSLRLGGDALRRLMGDGPLDDDDRAIVQMAAARDLTVHRNSGLVQAIAGAWEGFGPLLENYGATREEQAAFLYALAKSLLGLASDPDRAMEVARELEGMGETARSRWVTGEVLVQRRDLDGAVREWESVLAVDASNLDALFSLGTFHLDTNDYFQAERFLLQAVRSHPRVPVARYHLGRTFFHLGRYEEAIAELRKARELTGSPRTYPLVDYLAGLSAARLGRYAEAARALEDYLKWAYEQSILTRVEVDAHIKLAEVLDHQGKRFDALRQRQKADQLRGRIEAYGRMQQEGAPAGLPPGQAPGEPPPATQPPESDGR
jgi:tetratricopeptide (TPR) repeat protein